MNLRRRLGGNTVLRTREHGDSRIGSHRQRPERRGWFLRIRESKGLRAVLLLGGEKSSELACGRAALPLHDRWRAARPTHGAD